MAINSRENWIMYNRILDNEIELIIDKLIECDNDMYKDAIESAKWLLGKNNAE